MLSSRTSDTLPRAECWRLKIRVNDKVSRPTLRSVRLPGSHMPTLAIKTKLQRSFPPCFVLRPQRLGATSPREAFGVKVFQNKRRLTFFWRASALDVRWDCAAFGLQKNDASPRTKFHSKDKNFRGRAKHKTNALRTLRLWLAPCLSGASSAQLRQHHERLFYIMCLCNPQVY